LHWSKPPASNRGSANYIGASRAGKTRRSSTRQPARQKEKDMSLIASKQWLERMRPVSPSAPKNAPAAALADLAQALAGAIRAPNQALASFAPYPGAAPGAGAAPLPRPEPGHGHSLLIGPVPPQFDRRRWPKGLG
jgi:hypothetical protein